MSDENNTAQYSQQDLKELAETVGRFAEAMADAAARILDAVCELWCEALPELIDQVVNRIMGELERARSKEAAQRRREGRAAKPRPPIRKRLRTFRCRNCC